MRALKFLVAFQMFTDGLRAFESESVAFLSFFLKGFMSPQMITNLLLNAKYEIQVLAKESETFPKSLGMTIFSRSAGS